MAEHRPSSVKRLLQKFERVSIPLPDAVTPVHTLSPELIQVPAQKSALDRTTKEQHIEPGVRVVVCSGRGFPQHADGCSYVCLSILCDSVEVAELSIDHNVSKTKSHSFYCKERETLHIMPSFRTNTSTMVPPSWGVSTILKEANGAERQDIVGQNIILLVTVHSAQEVGEDTLIGRARIPLNDGTKSKDWHTLSTFGEPECEAECAVQLIIDYSGAQQKNSEEFHNVTVPINNVQADDLPAETLAELTGDIKPLPISSCASPSLDLDAVPEVSDLSEDSPLPSRRYGGHEIQLQGMAFSLKESPRIFTDWEGDNGSIGMHVNSDEWPISLSPTESSDASPDLLSMNNDASFANWSSFQASGTNSDKSPSTADLKQLFETSATIPTLQTGPDAVEGRNTNFTPSEVIEAQHEKPLSLCSDTAPKPQHRETHSERHLLPATGCAAGSLSNKDTKEAERRKDREEMNRMRTELDVMLAHRHIDSLERRQRRNVWAENGRSWSEKKDSYAVRRSRHEHKVVDFVLLKLKQTELELAVTKEELSVERGRRIQAEDRNVQLQGEITRITENLKLEQSKNLQLQELLSELERPASNEVIAQERRQLHLCRALSEFVLVCLLDKLRPFLSDCRHELASSTRERSAIHMMELRRECAKDMKSLTRLLDVINALTSTRDSAARYAVERAQQCLNETREVIIALRHSLTGTFRELEGIRLDLEALQAQDHTEASLAGVSLVELRDSTSFLNKSRAVRSRVDGYPLESSCLEIDSVQTQISTTLLLLEKVQKEFKVINKLCEQKDRTSNGLIASLIQSKDAISDEWSEHAFMDYGAQNRDAPDDGLKVKDHKTHVQELDAVLLAELCSSRRLHVHENSDKTEGVDRPSVSDWQISPASVHYKAAPYKGTRIFTNLKEAREAVQALNTSQPDTLDELPHEPVSVKASDSFLLTANGLESVKDLEIQHREQGLKLFDSAVKSYCPALQATEEDGLGRGLSRSSFFFGSGASTVSNDARKRAETELLEDLSRRHMTTPSPPKPVSPPLLQDAIFREKEQLTKSPHEIHGQFQYV